MAKFTEQDKLDALKEIKKVTQEIAAIDKERAKNQGIFLSSVQKEIIEFERAAQLQQDIVSAAEEQAAIERLNRDILKEQNFLAQAQNLAADKKLQLNLKIADLEQKRNEALADQTKFFNEMAVAATKDIKDAQKKAQVASDIADIQLKIKNNQITPKEAKKLLDTQKKIAEELTKQEERLQGITDSVADTTAGFANLLGIETDFSKGLDNILEGIISMGNEIEESGIAEVGKRVAEGISKSINLTNVLGSIAKSAFEQVMGILNMSAEITAATGMSRDFVLGFEKARVAANNLAGASVFLREEVFRVGQEITQSLQVFTTLGEESRVQISAIGATLSKVGVDMGDFSEAIADTMALTGKGAVESALEVDQLTKHMLAFGISPQEAVKNLASMAGKFAHMGAAGRKQFIELTKTAKALNVELDEVVSSIEQFDTLEQSIETSMQLNAIMQRLTGSTQQFFNPQELAMETNLDKRFEMLRKNFASTGLSLEEMANSGLKEHRFALKAISEVMGGIPVDELIKTYGQAGKETLKAAQGQKSFNDILADATSPADMMKATFQNLIADGTLIELAKGFANFARTVVELADRFGHLVVPLGVALGVFGSIMGIANVVMTLKAMATAFKITSLASLGLGASMGYVLLAVGAFVGAYMLFSGIGDFFAESLGPGIVAFGALALAIGLAYSAFTLGFGAAGIVAGMAAVAAGIVAAQQAIGGATGATGGGGGGTGGSPMGGISIPEMPKGFDSEGGFEIPALQTGGRIKGDGIAYLHADEEVMTPAEVEKKDATKAGNNANVSGDLTNAIMSPSMNVTVGQGIVKPDYSTTNELNAEDVGNKVAEKLSPLLKALGADIAKAVASSKGDVHLDGKKVGKLLDKKIGVSAMERKLSQMIGV